MATITTFTSTNRPRSRFKAVSDLATTSDDIELTGLDTTFTHCLASVQFFDGVGDPVAVATAGSFLLTIQTDGNDPNFETIPFSTIDATAPETLGWATNTLAVNITPTGLTGITSWRVTLNFNQT